MAQATLRSDLPGISAPLAISTPSNCLSVLSSPKDGSNLRNEYCAQLGIDEAEPNQESLLLEHYESIASLSEDPEGWRSRFSEAYHRDIEFLLTHPTGENLKTHACMGVAHTHTYRTADHNRVAPHILLAAEIAAEIADHLKLSSSDAINLVAAVAGHDQGHIFASHQSEMAINSFPEFDGSPGRPKFCHEVRTQELFKSEDFIRHFGAARAAEIRAILFDGNNSLHLLVDWSDRLAYLLADSIHLGIDEIISTSCVRPQFIKSLAMLPDGTIGFTSLDAVEKLVKARDMLFHSVNESPPATLFKGFLIEAYHRAVVWRNTTPTEFVKLIADRSTPEARKLFKPEDRQRLFRPHQEPLEARPVDLDYHAAITVGPEHLSAYGKAVVAEQTTVDYHHTTPACLHPRAGMTPIEHAIRSQFATWGGRGYAERAGIIIGEAYIPSKSYRLKHVSETGKIKGVELKGADSWNLFIAVPQDLHYNAPLIKRETCTALLNAGFITPEAYQELQATTPPYNYFTRRADLA